LNFSELNLNENLRKAIQRKGFSKPSEVQEKVIPAILSGKDVVGKAKTGTGKTAAFGIPLIEKITPCQGISALIVAPTRELAMQVKSEIGSLAIGSNLKVVAVFGGQSIGVQAKLLEKEPEIIVGTPGRLLDLLGRGIVSFRNTKHLILDEADKMFDMGFREDIERIILEFSRQRQTMVFSATMPSQILSLIKHHMKHDKIVFDLSEDNSPVEEVEQFYVMVDKNQKVDALSKMIRSDKNSKTLVFCRTKKTVDWLKRQLSRRGINVFAIHGDKQQNKRTNILEKYKRSFNGVLLATDLVARGIHVDDINKVINFDFPHEKETYIHRIGRTARQGKRGRAISFCSNLMEKQRLEQTCLIHNSRIQEIQ